MTGNKRQVATRRRRTSRSIEPVWIHSTKNWLPWQRPLRDRKNNFRSFVDGQSSTVAANFVKIGLADVEIIGLRQKSIDPLSQREAADFTSRCRTAPIRLPRDRTKHRERRTTDGIFVRRCAATSACQERSVSVEIRAERYRALIGD